MLLAEARDGAEVGSIVGRQQPKPFDVILVWKNNRLSRRVEHAVVYKGMLRRRGIQVVSVKEPEMPGPLQALVETILAAVDEFLCFQIAEDTLRGQKEIARQGYSPGGRPPKGLRSVKKVVGIKRNGEPIFRVIWELDPEWKDKALLAFRMAAEGKSSDEIIKATGIVSNKSSISTYLRNKAFIGHRVFNRRCHLDTKAIRRYNPPEQVIEVPNAHEAIVPIELFSWVQQILDKRRPKVATVRQLQSKFILTGLLWCPKHDCRYIGYPNNEREYYICSARNKGGKKAADCALIKREALENFILEGLKEEVFRPERLREMVSQIVEGVRCEKEAAKTELEKTEAQIHKAEQELRNLHKAIKDGIQASYLVEPIEETQAKLRALQQQRDELGGEGVPELRLTDRDIEDIVKIAWDTLSQEDPVQRKLFIQQYVRRIEISGEEVTLQYTFRDPHQKVATNWLPESINR